MSLITEVALVGGLVAVVVVALLLTRRVTIRQLVCPIFILLVLGTAAIPRVTVMHCRYQSGMTGESGTKWIPIWRLPESALIDGTTVLAELVALGLILFAVLRMLEGGKTASRS